MDSFSNRKFVEEFDKNDTPQDLLSSDRKTTLEMSLTNRLRRFSDPQPVESFDFPILGVEDGGSVLYLLSKSAIYTKRPSSGLATATYFGVIYVYDLYTGSVRKLKECPTEIIRIHYLSGSEAILAVDVNSNYYSIGTKSEYFFSLHGVNFFKEPSEAIIRKTESSVYLLSEKELFVWKISDTYSEPQKLLSLETVPTSFEVARCLKLFFFLTADGKVIAYHRKTQKKCRIQFTNGPVVELRIDPMEKKLVIKTSEELYAWSLANLELKLRDHLVNGSSEVVDLKARPSENQPSNSKDENILGESKTDKPDLMDNTVLGEENGLISQKSTIRAKKLKCLKLSKFMPEIQLEFVN